MVHLVPAPFGPHGLYGGAERYALELAKAMAKKVPTRLVTFGQKAREIQHSGGLIEIVLGNSWFIRGQRTNPYQSEMFKHFLWGNIIHCHQNHIFSAELAAIFGRLSGKRVFASDLGGGGWGLHGYFNTNSLFFGHLHISDYSRGLSGHNQNLRAKVIFGGVDTSFFKPDMDIPKEPLVLFVGRVMPHKGVNYLIEGLPDGLDLEIIGKPYNTEFQDHLNRLALGKRVRFRPDCNDLDIVRAYQRARCVALPVFFGIYMETRRKFRNCLGRPFWKGWLVGHLVW